VTLGLVIILQVLSRSSNLSHPGHINNVAYVRYAETARVNLMHNYAMHIDPAHQTEWLNTVGNKGVGLILQSINVTYKFVRDPPLSDRYI
jgi:acyl-CoA thioesterase FadM